MRWRRSLALLLATVAVVGAFAAWAFHRGAKVGGGWASTLEVWPFLAAGVLTVAVVIVAFVRLAIYSDEHGYDARAGRDER